MSDGYWPLVQSRAYWDGQRVAEIARRDAELHLLRRGSAEAVLALAEARGRERALRERVARLEEAYELLTLEVQEVHDLARQLGGRT